MKLSWQILTGLVVLIGGGRVEAQTLNPVEECRIVAHIARMFRYQSIDPFLGRDSLSRRKKGTDAVEVLDCTAIFTEAGLNMIEGPCDQNVYCYPYRARFGRLSLDKTNLDAAAIEVDELSDSFSQGFRLSLIRIDGVWQVKADEGTWIS